MQCGWNCTLEGVAAYPIRCLVAELRRRSCATLVNAHTRDNHTVCLFSTTNEMDFSITSAGHSQSLTECRQSRQTALISRADDP
jgi:hypothetical protein